MPYVSFLHQLSDARGIRDVGSVTGVKTASYSDYCTRQTDRQTDLCGFRSCCGTKNFWSQTPISEESDLSPCVGGQSQNESQLTGVRSSFQLNNLFSRLQSGAHTSSKASITYNQHRRNPTCRGIPVCIEGLKRAVSRHTIARSSPGSHRTLLLGRRLKLLRPELR